MTGYKLETDSLPNHLQIHGIRRKQYLLSRLGSTPSLINLCDYRTQLDRRRRKVILCNVLLLLIVSVSLASLTWLYKFVPASWNEVYLPISGVLFSIFVIVSDSWIRQTIWDRQDEGPQTLSEIAAERLLTEQIMKRVV